METLNIPIPQGFTKAQVLEIIADGNGYRETLKGTVTTTFETEQEAQEFYDNLFVDDQVSINGLEVQHVGDVPNKKTKEVFAKELIGQKLFGLLLTSVKTVQTKALRDQIKAIEDGVVQSISIDGLIIQ